MINKDNCILLGTLSKPHGTRGSLHFRFSGLKAEEIKERDLVFVEIDGLPVPFFIEVFQEKTDDSAILRFEGIDSVTKAREFAGYSVYVMKEQVRRKKLHVKQITEFNGYSVVDDHLGFVGNAGEVTSVPTSPLLTVTLKGKKFLVPFHESIIRHIDHREKVIRIDAPEGLFEL